MLLSRLPAGWRRQLLLTALVLALCLSTENNALTTNGIKIMLAVTAGTNVASRIIRLPSAPVSSAALLSVEVS